MQKKINTRLNHRLFFMRLFIKYLPSSQSGFSLIESLMAVAVVGILMTAILPMVVVTTTARVQARRADLASQAARSYTDGVRAGVVNIIDPPNGLSVYPFIDAGKANRNQYFTDVPAPSSANVANLFKIPGVKIDANGNGFSFADPQDLVIQPMRSPGTDLSTQGFYMGVRVYRADAFQSDTAIKSGINLQISCPNSNQIFGSSGGYPGCPLVVMKVDVYPSTSTLDQIKSRL